MPGNSAPVRGIGTTRTSYADTLISQGCRETVKQKLAIYRNCPKPCPGLPLFACASRKPAVPQGDRTIGSRLRGSIIFPHRTTTPRGCDREPGPTWDAIPLAFVPDCFRLAGPGLSRSGN